MVERSFSYLSCTYNLSVFGQADIRELEDRGNDDVFLVDLGSLHLG